LLIKLSMMLTLFQLVLISLLQLMK